MSVDVGRSSECRSSPVCSAVVVTLSSSHCLRGGNSWHGKNCGFRRITNPVTAQESHEGSFVPHDSALGYIYPHQLEPENDHGQWSCWIPKAAPGRVLEGVSAPNAAQELWGWGTNSNGPLVLVSFCGQRERNSMNASFSVWKGVRLRKGHSTVSALRWMKPQLLEAKDQHLSTRFKGFSSASICIASLSWPTLY